MFFRRDRNKRYVARDLNWRPILGVRTGVVDDTQPWLPSRVVRKGAGWQYVTTLSRAKRIARHANRVDR